MIPQVVISTGGIFATIFYCDATIYSPSIEQSFLDNQFLSSANDTGFDWYSKYGGGNTVLNVISHLKEKRVIFSIPL